jgi:beta-phosphoglucomutase-like phosphatase (HAD superfamily)
MGFAARCVLQKNLGKQMIRLIFFDLGETLIHQNEPLPNVVQALTALAAFKTQAGSALMLSIVSDFGTDGSVSESHIRAFESEFVEILRSAGIMPFFQPFETRVTISARAGVRKPDRTVFEVAAKRSGLHVELSECLFITENKAHLLAARNYGITVLGFGSISDGASAIGMFSNWLDAPLLIAHIVAPENTPNFERGLSLVLQKQNGINEFKCLKRNGLTFQGQGTKLMQLERGELGTLNGAFVEMPVDISIQCNARGTIDHVVVNQLTEEDMEEAVSYVQHLVRQGQISSSAESMSSRASHAIETDSAGRRIIVRQNFSQR